MSANTAPLQEDDFLDIIEPLPAPSELPYIELATKGHSRPTQVFDLKTKQAVNINTRNFITPPQLTSD